MKKLLLTLIVTISLNAQEHSSAYLDSLLLVNEFHLALNDAKELNSDVYINMINGILHIEKFKPEELKLSYYEYLKKGNDFIAANVGVNSVYAYNKFIEAFSKEQYIIGVQNYKLAAFYKNKFQEEKLSILLNSVEKIKNYMAADEYEKANALVMDCDSIEVILQSNRNYNEEVYEYEKFKRAFKISERQSKIRTDFDYSNPSDKILSARLKISLFDNTGGSGKMTEFYNGEQTIFRNSRVTYIYRYKPKIAYAVDFGIMCKLYKELRLGAYYNFYSYLDGKEIDFEVELSVPKYPQYSTVLNPEPTYLKINGNGVRLTVDYSFFKDYIIHPVIGIDYYYGKVSYRGPLGMLRDPYPLFFYDKAAFSDQIYSGLDARIGAEIFYSKQSDLFLDVNYEMNLVKRKLSIHQKEGTFSFSFGYYIF